MKLVDANVLLYALNRDAAAHEPSRRWLDGALSGAETVRPRLRALRGCRLVAAARFVAARPAARRVSPTG